jgi:hypothetical protein
MDNPVTQQYWTQKKVKERKVNTTRGVSSGAATV